MYTFDDLHGFGITTIVQYRWQSGKRRGLVVAQYNHSDRSYRVGWSQCNINQGDTFDAVFGRHIAVGRCLGSIGYLSPWDAMSKVPDGLQEVAGNVVARLLEADQRVQTRLALQESDSHLGDERSTDDLWTAGADDSLMACSPLAGNGTSMGAEA